VDRVFLLTGDGLCEVVGVAANGVPTILIE